MDLSTAQRHALIVLGMHRAGTSPLADALAQAGGTRASGLALSAFHEALLAAAGGPSGDWATIDPAFYGSEAATGFRQRLPHVLEQAYGAAEWLLVEDPRTSRALPLWLAVLSQLDIRPHLFVAVTHPYDVARSLGEHENISERRALLLWLRHSLEAEALTRDLPRRFFRDERYFGDWRDEPALRQDDATDDPLAAWVLDTAGALAALAAGGSDAELAQARATLDAIREELDETAGIFQEAHLDLLHSLRVRADQYWERVLDLEARHAAADAEAEVRFTEIANLTRRVLRYEGRVKRTDAALEAAERRLRDLEESTSWRLTQPVRRISGGLRRIRTRKEGQPG